MIGSRGWLADNQASHRQDFRNGEHASSQDPQLHHVINVAEVIQPAALENPRRCSGAHGPHNLCMCLCSHPMSGLFATISEGSVFRVTAGAHIPDRGTHWRTGWSARHMACWGAGLGKGQALHRWGPSPPLSQNYATPHDTGCLLLVNREIQVCLLFVCLLAACMLAGLLACLFACCLLDCLWIASCGLACLLACYLVGLPAFRFDSRADSVAIALMPASYAAAHAEPKENRADRIQLLHTIAYSGVGAP